MTTALKQHFSQAKTKLLVVYPYFGTLASRLRLQANENHESFLSDGTLFEYNPEYIERLSVDELGFALANGAMHAALSHQMRQQGRMSWLWQLASDYAINAMLVQNGLSLPQGVHYDVRFEGMYAEAIYATLKDEIKNEAYSDDEKSDTGYNENNQRKENALHHPDSQSARDANRPQMEVEHHLDEAAFEQMLKQLNAKMDAQGELPQGIERFVTLSHRSRIDWRTLLHHALDRHFKNDYRMMPPSKKLLYQGVYLPSLYGERLSLVVAIDSSGSVDEVLLGYFIDELEALLLSFLEVHIELLVCDDRIRFHSSMSGGERLEYQLIGGGGTSFKPVFEYIETQALSCNLLLYFSDLEGSFPTTTPNYETLWIAPKTKSVPFGEVIVI
jgi:predicted metal-dependent peptidase